MHIKHTSLLAALILVSSFDAYAININGAPIASTPRAKDDFNSVIIDEKTEATGNVIANDLFGTIVTFNQSAGKYGFLTILGSAGVYTYKLYNSTDNSSLAPSGVDTDSFSYTLSNANGQTSNARLNIQVNVNPAFAVKNPDAGNNDDLYDNVDIEFNNRSTQATSLNSGRNIKGHLYNSSDKDWYSLASAGNEIITLEVCPRGTSCFGQKSWVLYVFDPDRLKALNEQGRGENDFYTFRRWVDATGNNQDPSGAEIISGEAGSSNHIYLAYNLGFYEGALIGIVDPCFDTLNTVDIGVPPGARNYLIAISSPLKGDVDSAEPNSCGQGSILLQREGNPAAGHEKSSTDENGNVVEGDAASFPTTEEYIVSSPNSDDQYAIKITGTGLNPLNTAEAIARSASFNPATGNLRIPKVKIQDQYFNANLEQLSLQERSADSGINFVLSTIEELTIDEVVDAYRATYNPENQQVMIPRVTDTSTGTGYSVILQYHADDNENANDWLEVISIQEIL